MTRRQTKKEIVRDRGGEHSCMNDSDKKTNKERRYGKKGERVESRAI